MFRYYDVKLIHSKRSYTVEQIRNLYKQKKLHPQTIRGWVKDGLIGTISTNPIIIHGSVLKEFLITRQKQRKKHLDLNQTKCLYCKKISVPKNNEIALCQNKNGSWKASCVCAVCNRSTFRFYKKNDREKLNDLFVIKQLEMTTLCDSLSDACKTHSDNGFNTASNEPNDNQSGLPKGTDENKTIPLSANNSEPHKSSIKYNQKNELMKAKFFEVLSGARGWDPKTITSYSNSLHEFEKSTGFKDFKTFNVKQAINFKEFVLQKRNKKTGEIVSKTYAGHCVAHAKEFFEWFSKQRGYDKSFDRNAAEYLALSRNDRNRAKATAHPDSYLIEEIIDTIRKMPSSDETEMRNKAMISLCLLTTPRISALQTARIGSIKYFKREDAWAFFQDPNLVNTKLATSITAFFIGHLQDIYRNVLSWVEFLKAKGFDDKSPLFPKIMPTFNQSAISSLVVRKNFIRSHATVRGLFESAFKSNNLPYKKPHSFRHSMTLKMMNSDKSPLLVSALSRNMGHRDASVLMANYGGSPEHERAGILKNFELE